MTTIGEFVHLDTQGQFRSDVQLDAFDKPELNLSLLRSYIFTTHTPEGYRSSLLILIDLVNAFISPIAENRMVTIANFGHGKSHTALALANFFAKNIESEEVQVILEKIKQAAPDPTFPARIKAFKENKGKFLVLRMRGDMHNSLRDQFIKNLEKTLNEYEETQHTQLPFWFREAELFLTGLEGDKLKAANTYLQSSMMDVPLLLNDVSERNHNVYDLCVNLHRHINKTTTSFGGETSIKEVIDWVVNKYCGPDKPFGGLLILFDELSAYILEYARRGASVELMDLLNGIDNNRGKAVFMAYAQHSPLTTARNAVSGGIVLDSIIHELSRIPKEIFLSSLMESVINAYLKQEPQIWVQLLQNRTIAKQINDASYTTYDLFSQRYQNNLEWKTARFIDVITKGCFPLHPMTTALLCNVRFQTAAAGANPRTVLGFVMDQVREKKADQAIIVNNQLNWVLPIELVDFFKEQLSGEKFKQYTAAYEKIGGIVAADEIKKVLKALVLEQVADLPIKRDEDQIPEFCEMTGLQEVDVRAAVNILVDRGAVRKDNSTKRISFYSSDSNITVIEEILENKLSKTKLEWDDFLKLASQLPKIEPNINWAKPSDWAATNYFVRIEDFKEAKIRELVYPFESSTHGFKSGVQGCILWCLAKNEDELSTFRDTTTNLLDKSVDGQSPIPVLVVLPHIPTAELFEAMLRVKALNSFAPEEKQRGLDVHNDLLWRARDDVDNALKELQFDRYSIGSQRSHNAYRASAKYMHSLIGLTNTTVNSVLTTLYKTAYRLSPTEFTTSYTAVKMKEGVRFLCRLLLQNNISGNLVGLEGVPIAKSIVENILKPKWKILNPAYKIQEPKDARIKAVWDYFSESFSPGKSGVITSSVLIPLFNPPYGYDHFTLILLFTSWIGFHFRYLSFSQNNQYSGLQDLTELLMNDPKDFVNRFTNTDRLKEMRITRREPSEILQKVKGIVNRVESGEVPFTLSDAKIAIQQLQEFLDDENTAEEDLDRYQPAMNELLEAKKNVDDYDTQARAILEGLAKNYSLNTIIGYREAIHKLPRCILVKPTTKSEQELQSMVTDKLKSSVDDFCSTYAQLNQLTQYELYYEHLVSLKKLLNSTGITDLLERVDKALTDLAARKIILERQQKEAGILVLLQSMDPQAGLKQLYIYIKRLEELRDYSPRIEASRYEKMEAIQKSINAIELECNAIVDNLEHISSLSQADQWWLKWSRYQEKVQGTPLAKGMESSGKKFERVKEILGILARLVNNRIHTTEDFREFQHQLNGIVTKVRGFTTEGLQKAILESQNSLNNQRTNKEVEARTTLEQLEKSFSKEISPYNLLKQLEQQPQFLPAECNERWTVLKQAVKEKLDQSTAETILEMFKSINDEKKRIELITELQKLLVIQG